ncbi:MAG: threonine synthase [Candidatus Schekmanbacteria bacterium]|nr:threonine synthase [Candidatus Schekmanbacteria bacterium]
MSYVKGLRCRECNREYSQAPIYVCEFCFGPLEVVYDYPAISRVLNITAITSRTNSLWRYRELLPIDGDPTVGLYSGYTPLIRSQRLAEALGVDELYIKDDSVCHPTFSFKDRVVAVALTKAKEFGFDTVACASTGNLGNAVSAHAARANLRGYIFIPADLELGKVVGSLVYAPNLIAVEGNYDEVNRLCSEIASQYKWAFVNINLRPFYAEGSKSYGFEVVEQMGWRYPKHIVVPAASGSLITKIWKGFEELHKIGIMSAAPQTKVYGAQGKGCAPIITSLKNGWDGIRPVKPVTLAKSLAIGNPADGYYALQILRNTGGGGEEVTNEEIIEGIKLLARTEGVFTETAGGVTVAAAKKLIEQGVIPKNESIVICITGNGLKTQEAITGAIGQPIEIEPTLASFEKKAFKK